MNNSDLEMIRQRYESAIASLESTKKQFTPPQVLEVLTARDALQEFLTKNFDKFTNHLAEVVEVTEENPLEALEKPVNNCLIQLSQIPQLDRRLQQQGASIAQSVNLDRWRESFQPSPEAWWWFFEAKKEVHKLDKYDWIWSGLSMIFLTGAFTFLAETASPFLRVEPDIFGSFTVISQSVLTYLTAKGALTQKGQEAIEHFLGTIDLPKFLWQEVKLGLSIVLFISFFAFHSQLPRVGQYYFRKGQINYAKNQLISAETNYKRALEFELNDANIYYRLALVYENMQDDKKALTNYLIAADGGSVAAYNNLSRLYILEGKYIEAAIAATQGQKILHQKYHQDYLPNEPLTESTKSENEDDILLREHEIKHSQIRAYLRKNLGWARLKQGRLAAAKAELERAIRLKNDLGSAHCLLAEVLEKQTSETNALAQWENCLAYARAGNPDEENWIQIAQQRLTEISNSENQPE